MAGVGESAAVDRAATTPAIVSATRVMVERMASVLSSWARGGLPFALDRRFGLAGSVSVDAR